MNKELELEFGKLQSILGKIKRLCDGKYHTCAHHPALSCHACEILEIIKDEMDDCSICHGFSGGVKGNTHIKNGIVVCDYCSAEMS